MSVATEFPPEVHIPDRARRSMREVRPQVRPDVWTGAGTQTVTRHLALVPSAVPAPQPYGPPTSVPANQKVSHRQRLSVAQPTSRPVRLTRRGSAVLALVTVALGLLLLVVAHASVGAAPKTLPAQQAVSADGAVTVQPGDTLWSIARRVAPNRDPRVVVDHLQQVNHLAGVSLMPGQTLKVG
jgi:LysM repeat protein